MASKHLFSTKVTDNTSDQREQLGAVRREWDNDDNCFKTYRYVRASLTTAASNGVCMSCHIGRGSSVVQGLGCTVVTDDIAEGAINLPAGVAIGTLTNQYYGWVQIGGYHSEVDTDGGTDLNDGDTLILHASTVGVCDVTDAGTAPVSKPIGIAVADYSGSEVAALLTCTFGDIVQ